MWLQEKKPMALRGLDSSILFVYVIIATLQSAWFGRVYSAYKGIFTVSAITWSNKDCHGMKLGLHQDLL
jgi:small multidrug resistance family-3 protein